MIWDTTLDEVLGKGGFPPAVTGARLRNVKTGEKTDIAVDGIFIAIGHEPAVSLFRDQLRLKPSGYIWTRLARPRPAFRASMLPATWPTTCIAKLSPPPGWAAWRRSRRRSTSMASRRRAKRRSRDAEYPSRGHRSRRARSTGTSCGSSTPLPRRARSRAPARRSNMSQSAVSRQVSALEQELGTTLFHRHARGLIPTERGRAPDARRARHHAEAGGRPRRSWSIRAASRPERCGSPRRSASARPGSPRA